MEIYFNMRNKIVAITSSLFILSGCQNIIPMPISNNSASLKISMKILDSSMHIQSFDSTLVKKIRVFIKGIGIDPPILPTSATPSYANPIIDLSEGNSFTADFSNIPVGKNRIITLQGLNNAGNLLGQVKSLIDINSGANNLNSINWRTTPAADIVEKILYDKALPFLAAGIDPLKLQSNIDMLTGYDGNNFTKRHPSLLNTDILASDIVRLNNIPEKMAAPDMPAISPDVESNVAKTTITLDGNNPSTPDVALFIRKGPLKGIKSVESFTVKLLDPTSTAPLSVRYPDLSTFPVVTFPSGINYYRIPYKIENITPNIYPGNNYILIWNCKYTDLFNRPQEEGNNIFNLVNPSNPADFKIIVDNILG